MTGARSDSPAGHFLANRQRSVSSETADMSQSPPGNDPSSPDTSIYIQCMSEVRERLDAVMLLAFSEKVFKGTSDFLLETQFLQLRKVLEVMAFASLTANQAK